MGKADKSLFKERKKEALACYRKSHKYNVLDHCWCALVCQWCLRPQEEPYGAYMPSNKWNFGAIGCLVYVAALESYTIFLYAVYL